MKFLATTSVALLSAVLLVACGGDSDSSGNNNSTTTPKPTTPTTPKPTTPKPTVAKCEKNGFNILVPQGSCEIAIPGVNGGDISTYYCSGSRVSLGDPNSGSISAGTLNLNGYTIKCK